MRNNLTKKEKLEQRAEALRMLVENYGVKPGSVIYYAVNSRTATGAHVISFYIVHDGEISDITYLFCRILDYPRTLNSGLKSGRSDGHDCIYSVSRALYPDGAPDGGVGEIRKDGGYALRNRRL